MFLPGPALLSGAINATWITSCRAARVFGCPAGLGHPKRTFWLLQNEKTHTKQIPMTDTNGAAILMVLHWSHQQKTQSIVSINKNRHRLDPSWELKRWFETIRNHVSRWSVELLFFWSVDDSSRIRKVMVVARVATYWRWANKDLVRPGVSSKWWDEAPHNDIP